MNSNTVIVLTDVQKIQQAMQAPVCIKPDMERQKCPNAPVLKPRNLWFKFNSDKWFLPLENLVEYTPFFYSEGDETSEDDFHESTNDTPAAAAKKIYTKIPDFRYA